MSENKPNAAKSDASSSQLSSAQIEFARAVGRLLAARWQNEVDAAKKGSKADIGAGAAPDSGESG